MFLYGVLWVGWVGGSSLVGVSLADFDRESLFWIIYNLGKIVFRFSVFRCQFYRDFEICLCCNDFSECNVSVKSFVGNSFVEWMSSS